MASSLNFEKLNGTGTKIGVADTEIDTSHPALEQCAHMGVSLLDTKKVQSHGTTSSIPAQIAIGHGTAIAYIIHRKAPACRIFSIQILDERLTSSIHRLIDAIDWAIEQKLDIINLSLGSTHLHRKNEVEAAIQRANKSNLLIVSSCHNRGKESIPASLPGVFGVSGGSVHGKYNYYWEENHKFIARGDHQRVASPGGKYIFSFGSSCAAAHMTGIIALIRQAIPGATYSQVLSVLISNARSFSPGNEMSKHQILNPVFPDIQTIVLKAQQELNSELILTQADALRDPVRDIVACTLNISREDMVRLYSTTLLDPIFNLNREVAMHVIEKLERKFNITIDDEDLFLNDFFSLNSLVKAVRRWQSSSDHSSLVQMDS